MAVAYYLCPIIGDGTIDNPYRSKAHLYAQNIATVISTRPSDGRLTGTRALSMVACGDHAALLGDPDIEFIPIDRVMLVGREIDPNFTLTSMRASG